MGRRPEPDHPGGRAPTQAGANPEHIRSTGVLPVADSEDRYAPRGLLGQGGMARVELCHDRRLDRAVARKALRPELQEQGALQRRFAREVQVQAKLEHPAIVPVFDWGHDEDGHFFFTMRRIGGYTLGKAIEGMVTIPGPEDRSRERNRLLASFLQACLAIDYAHSRGVIHRDIKPDNLMLGRFGELYVLDWGIAKLCAEPGDTTTPHTGPAPEDLTEVRSTLGTRQYMSPEQHNDPAQVTPRSDVYSLGAVLFQILTGRLLRADLQHWPEGDALAPSRQEPSLPPEFDAICRTACDPLPARRYPSARALHDAVERVLRGDRDLALRRELAVEHLRAAEANDAAGHSVAGMREASRALSLDPTNAAAAAFLTRRLLAPPDNDPPPLRAERARVDAEDGRRILMNNARFALVSLLAVVPAVLVHEVYSVKLLALMLGPPIFGTVVLAMAVPGSRPTGINIVQALVISPAFSVPIAVSAAVCGPWVLPPLIAFACCVTAATVVATGWRRVVAVGVPVLTLVATLWVYGGSGVSAEQLATEAVIGRFDPFWTPLCFSAICLALLGTTVAAVWRNVNAMWHSRQLLQRQEWWLRQVTAPEQDPP